MPANRTAPVVDDEKIGGGNMVIWGASAVVGITRGDGDGRRFEVEACAQPMRILSQEINTANADQVFTAAHSGQLVSFPAVAKKNAPARVAGAAPHRAPSSI